MACFSDDIIFDAATGSEVFGTRFVGKEAVRAAFVSTWASFPDVAWHVGRHSLVGDLAFSEWVFAAHRGDGKRIEIEGIDLFIFDGDLICSKRAFRKERPPQPGIRPAATLAEEASA
ncbi:MAG: hypothetical protein NVSMB26_16330 [Beijerinckiaceae bacterium]